MAQDSWPSPSHNTRNVTDSEYERVAAFFSGDGIWGDPTDTAVVSAGAGLQVVVRADAWASVRGHAWTSGTTAVNLTIGSNTSGSTRVDRVALRLDRSAWTVRAVVRAGTPGAGAPALVRDSGDTGLWEIPLATVTVPNAAASVTVARGELYIGGRIRPVLSTALPPTPSRGDVEYQTDTNRLTIYDGSARRTLWEDSGQVTLGASGSNWEAVGTSVGRKVGATVRLRIWLRRINTTLSAGNPDGSLLGSVPPELAPTVTEFFPVRVSGSGGVANVQVSTDGEIRLIENSADITPGRHVPVTMTYLRV